MKIDIITGFLGAGKTTFISKYAKFLKEKNEKIIIIENELSAVDVDGKILKEENLTIAEISGGCACCTQVPRLIACINDAWAENYDRVIFEPTGIYNLDSFFALLEHPNLKAEVEIGAIITVVKPDFMKHKDTAKNTILSQFLSTGAVLFSNTQSYSQEEINNSITSLNKFVTENNNNFDISKLLIITKNWDNLDHDDFANLSSVGGTYCEHKSVYEDHAFMLQSMFFMGRIDKSSNIKTLTDELFSNKDFGIIRIKGYFSDKEKNAYFINCTQNCYSIKSSTNKHTLVSVIGKNLDDSKINDIVKKYK